MKWLKSYVANFLIKVVGIYLLWYLVYELWLLPDSRLDEWVTTNIVAVSAGLLELMGYDLYATGRLIGIEDAAGIYLADGCSGISAIGLFVGFVIAYPGAWIPRMAFIFIGIGIIYFVNIIRIIVLAITQVQAPDMFAVTHDYSTPAIFYAVIFLLWVAWAYLGDDESLTGRSTTITS